ncbi:rhomboid-related protein 4 isoform X2 [Amia ocellicauda]|uniref:rhomboid-related protein 4 isoform X2 n=1 Tax=Amia ocellicauda TaxID=2972642 RepID=UPI003463BC9C
MRPRQRGINVGLLLLISQIYQVGFNNIPPVTLATLGLNIYLFLAPLKNLLNVCISVQHAFTYRDWQRLLFSPFHHADDWHLYFNMVSLLYKGVRLEKRLGSPWFGYIIAVFSLLTGVMYILLEMALSEVTNDPSYKMQCAVGFSGVLFALKVVNNHYFPGGVTHVMGVPVVNKYACWAELVLIHFMSPGTSFVGHLAGILVGLMYTMGPLKTLMKTSAGFLSPDRSGTRQTYNYSGYSGYQAQDPYRGYDRHYPSQPHAWNSGYRPSQVYTGGLSEEEQYEAAVRASLNDREVCCASHSCNLSSRTRG